MFKVVRVLHYQHAIWTCDGWGYGATHHPQYLRLCTLLNTPGTRWLGKWVCIAAQLRKFQPYHEPNSKSKTVQTT